MKSILRLLEMILKLKTENFRKLQKKTLSEKEKSLLKWRQKLAHFANELQNDWRIFSPLWRFGTSEYCAF
ncbi:hypothetical protein [Chryseobacterium indoltheticum]|uniref:hypothetical protein n=1 Tax=Chryseobacterium indoltheticum TaxID=254 RepID=UPI003F498820